jgi:outer membrane protein TolC
MTVFAPIPRKRVLSAAWPIMVCALLAGCAQPPADEDELTLVARPGAVGAEAPGRMAPSLAATPFGQAVAVAVQSYPALAAGGARIRAAEAALAGEQGAYLPQVSLGAETGVRRVGGASTNRSSPVLEITQLVYDGGAAVQRTSAARARVAQTANDRLALAASLTMQAVEAWHEVLHRRRLLELAGRNMALHREFLRQTEDRVGAGAGAETDLLTAQSRLADATARRVTAQSRLDRAEAEFRELYGRAATGIVPPAPAPGLPGTAAEIVDQSPRLRSIDASILAAQAELQAARAGTRPNIVMRVTGGTDARGRADVGANIGFQYDLDTGRRREAAVRSAEARVLELEAERESLSRQIGRALDFVRSDQRAGAERMRAALAARRANEANVTAVREQFGIGRRGITELLDAQRDFIASSEAVFEAELELAISGYAALALTGDILDVFGIMLPAPESTGGAAR